VKGEGTLAKSGGYIPTLDGWRACAILAVIFSHASTSASGLEKLPHWLLWVKVGCGEKGVQLFFAISGFLITSRLIEEWNCFGRISLKRFYVRRVCRILPPAMTYLLFIGLLGLIGVLSLEWRYWLSAVCFYRNNMPLGGAAFDAHYWSLSIEEQFYLIWPALLVLSGLSRSKYTASILIFAIWCWRWIAYHHVFGLTRGVQNWWRSDICFDGLLVGCLFALALESATVKKWLTKCLTVWVVAAIVVIILATGGHTNTPSGRTIQSLLMPFLIVATILNPRTWLGLLLEVPVTRWIGRLSYSLYIWQQLFAFQRMLPWYPLQLVALFGMAALSFYAIEKPMIRLGYRLAPPPSLGHNDLGAVHSLSGEIPASERVESKELVS
jgi:peptidoglycan/LPS O-acetylase OafA/YrhL